MDYNGSKSMRRVHVGLAKPRGRRRLVTFHSRCDWTLTMLAETTSQISAALRSVLAQAGSRTYGERELRREAKECMGGMWRDALNHRVDPARPFFSFVVSDGIAIFTIFDDPFEIYVFPCEERELIRTFEDEFAMRDVGLCKQLLATRHGKEAPDVAAARSLAQLWMEAE